MTVFSEIFRTARTEGLGVTLHIAEVRFNNDDFLTFKFSLGDEMEGDSLAEETMELLSSEPERLGHATFLDAEAKEVVLKRRTCIEICLTSNLLCAILTLSPPRG
jgi:adenosine deaminase